MTAIQSKLRRAVQRHGLFGICRVATGQVWGQVSKLRPSVRATNLRAEERAREFDEEYGVDTRGYIHPTQLTLNQRNQVHAVSYGASDPQDVRSALASLPIVYENFSFVDFGSGKGRVLLLASEFPFKQVVGVEFSEELHRVAEQNISKLPRRKGGCEKVESVCVDAVEYALPDDNLVCYFCNPFDEDVMSQVVANIRESLRLSRRDIYVLYY